jgi:hypothetical protein
VVITVARGVVERRTPMPEVSVDWTALVKSPLVMLIPVTVGVTLIVWVVTEAASFFVPSKWRPMVAMWLGPHVGWAVNRLELLDFGWGPAGWGRAVFFGLVGGALAVLGHDRIKKTPPFSWLAQVTPPATPAQPGGGQP